MWKYILIILFLFFAIREINLMDSSIHFTPDQKKVIVDDETLTSKLITLAKQKTLNDREYEENIAKEYKIKKPKPPLPPEEEREKKEEIRDETFSNLTLQKIETNQSSQEITPALDKIEQSITKNDKIDKVKESENNISTAKISQPIPKTISKEKEIEKPKQQPQNLETLEIKENDEPFKSPNGLPASFESAQERVNAILREMKR